jgi:carbon monoxide dehydrogenase subunit G
VVAKGELMKISGEATLKAPVEKVWAALLDPAVLAGAVVTRRR